MNPGLAVLKALASSCSVVMILSSAPSLYDIHKRHDTGDVALFPLVGLWLNCVMVLLYGWATFLCSPHTCLVQLYQQRTLACTSGGPKHGRTV
ncbi:hypothetical protein PI125_g13946 [Phytophthora idaei]|nr:hypothetical protein PI125_g13946 [Phytophthora idaei]